MTEHEAMIIEKRRLQADPYSTFNDYAVEMLVYGDIKQINLVDQEKIEHMAKALDNYYNQMNAIARNMNQLAKAGNSISRDYETISHYEQMRKYENLLKQKSIAQEEYDRMKKNKCYDFELRDYENQFILPINTEIETIKKNLQDFNNKAINTFGNLEGHYKLLYEDIYQQLLTLYGYLVGEVILESYRMKRKRQAPKFSPYIRKNKP